MKEKRTILKDPDAHNKHKDFLIKVKETNDSIKKHLTPEYRNQYNIRRLISCILLFLILRSWVSNFTWPFINDDTLFSIDSIYPLIYSIIAWKFWHYSFWSFKGGVIDDLSKRIFYIGSIWTVLGKIFLQNFVILIWIAIIAPFSGIKTWLKAVKHDKVLFYGIEKW